MKSARCDPIEHLYSPLLADNIANLKCFGAPGHHRPNFDGFIYIHYAAPPYSVRISAIYLFPFGKLFGSVGFVQRLTTKQNAEFTGVGKNYGPVLSSLWAKVHEIFRQCRRPFVLSSALARLYTSCSFEKIVTINR